VDLKLGPHSGGCGACSGVVTVDANNATQPPVIRYNNEYYLIQHFASLLPSEQSRSVVTNITGSATGKLNQTLALGFTVRNSGRVLQLVNSDFVPQEIVVKDETLQQCFATTLPSQSLTSFTWDAQNKTEEIASA